MSEYCNQLLPPCINTSKLGENPRNGSIPTVVREAENRTIKKPTTVLDAEKPQHMLLVVFMFCKSLKDNAILAPT